MSRSTPTVVDRPAVSVLHHDPPLTPRRFLGDRPYLFGAVIGAVVVLAVLAAYDGSRVLLEIDAPVARWVSDRRTDTWTSVFNALSRPGDNLIVFPLGLVLAALCWRHCRVLSGALLVAVALRPGFEFLLKGGIGRVRPTIDPIGDFSGPSHPSGHPMAAASFWGLMPAVSALFHGGRRIWWAVSAVSIVIVVGVAAARVYKGAHWLTDVIAALLWGVLYLLVVQGTFDRFHHLSECHDPVVPEDLDA